MQTRLLHRANASEEERMKNPAVWFGHKRCRPAKTKGHRQGWSLEDVVVGSFVCFEADESSEYSRTPGFEVGQVTEVPIELNEECKLQVEYRQFDP